VIQHRQARGSEDFLDTGGRSLYLPPGIASRRASPSAPPVTAVKPDAALVIYGDILNLRRDTAPPGVGGRRLIDPNSLLRSVGLLLDFEFGDVPSRTGYEQPRQDSDLAIFAARHRSGYTSEEARAIWNDHRTGAKQRRYDDPAQFMSDSRKAYERVTGEKLDWIGKSAGHTPPLRNESKET